MTTPELQIYTLKIVGPDTSVSTPALTFEEAADRLALFYAEGFESIEAWTEDRPINENEMQKLIKRAGELIVP